MKQFICIIYLFLFLMLTQRTVAQQKFDNVYSGNFVQGQLVQYMTDGSMVYAGEIISSGYYQLVIGRIDANGNVLWTKKIQSNSFKRMVDLKITPTNKIYICGETYTDLTNQYTWDIFLISLDSMGTILSSQKFGENSVHDTPKRLIVEGESIVMLTVGSDSITYYNYFGLLKIDSTNHVVWQKNYDHGSFLYSVYPAMGGGYIATTYYQPELFRFDSLGNYILNSGVVLDFGLPSSNIRIIKPISHSMYLGVGSSGLLAFFDYNLNPVKYIIYNGLSNIQDFFPTDHNTFILISIGDFCDTGCNIRSAEIDTMGNILQASVLTTHRYFDIFRPLTFGYRNNLLCIAADTGYYVNYPNQALELIQTDIALDSVCSQDTTSYSNAVIINPTVYNINIQNSASVSHLSPFPVTITNFPISFLNCESTPLGIIAGAKPEISIFPNPAAEWIKISIPEFSQSALIAITDLRGETVLKRKITQSGTEINLNNINPGFYFLSVYSDKLKCVYKLQKQ